MFVGLGHVLRKASVAASPEHVRTVAVASQVISITTFSYCVWTGFLLWLCCVGACAASASCEALPGLARVKLKKVTLGCIRMRLTWLLFLVPGAHPSGFRRQDRAVRRKSCCRLNQSQACHRTAHNDVPFRGCSQLASTVRVTKTQRLPSWRKTSEARACSD